MPKPPPGQPVLGVTAKTPFAVMSDAAPFAVMVPVEEPETKLICRFRFNPASTGWVTLPEILKVVPVLLIPEMHEDVGLLTEATVPTRVLPF
jgi:hypothetical protein